MNRAPNRSGWGSHAQRWASAWSPRVHPVWIVALILSVLLVAAFLGDNGALQLWRLRVEVEALHRQVQTLEAENDRLTRTITDLRSDPAAIERLAREELGLVREGERVLRFPRKQPTTPPLPPETERRP